MLCTRSSRATWWQEDLIWPAMLSYSASSVGLRSTSGGGLGSCGICHRTPATSVYCPGLIHHPSLKGASASSRHRELAS